MPPNIHLWTLASDDSVTDITFTTAYIRTILKRVGKAYFSFVCDLFSSI